MSMAPGKAAGNIKVVMLEVKDHGVDSRVLVETEALQLFTVPV